MIQEQYPERRSESHRREITHDPDPNDIHSSHETETELREPLSYRQRRDYSDQAHEHEPRMREDYDFEDAPPEVKTVFSTSGINIVAGLWLILAPFALGYSGVEAAVWNSIVLGLAVGVMALVRVLQPTEYEGVSWVNFVLGIWLLVSPFVLGLANIEPLVWNNIIVGVVVLALAATSALATRQLHESTFNHSRQKRTGRRRRPSRT